MKILILSEGRVGSHSIGNWLSKELEIPFFTEIEKCDVIINQNFIQKIYFFKSKQSKINFNFYDKVIIVYRNDTFNQAISNVYSIKTKKYIHTDGILNGYYNITKEFCIKNYLHIAYLIETLNDNNKILKKMNIGLLISYEEIFVDKTGQKKIEEYIGFKSKTILADEKHKLRVPNVEIEEYLKKLIKISKKRII
jgi:hypothetical protein